MSARGIWAVALVLGLLASPVLSLYCGEADAAAMACCQREADACHQPGKADGCCPGAPVSRESAGVLLKLKAAGPEKPGPAPILAAFVALADGRPVSLRPAVRARAVERLDALPPPGSVLRI